MHDMSSIGTKEGRRFCGREVPRQPRRFSQWVILACLVSALPASAGLVSAGPNPVKMFRVYEIALSATSPGTLPYTNAGVTATFTHTSGTNFTVRGFWDGGSTWRLRFAPTLTGVWSWTTTSTDSRLNGAASNFTAVTSTPAEIATNQLLRGFIKRDGYAWRLCDDSIFVPIGDTSWFLGEIFSLTEFQTWMDVLKIRGLNSIQGCVWINILNRVGTPFTGSPPGDNLNVAYFQRLDQMLQYANDQGGMIGLCIGGFPGNSAWWSSSMFNTQARDDRWFKYIIARYAALNVRWVLYGEVNEANPSWGTWQSEVAHKAQLVKDEDPYDHPIGSHHNSIDTSSIGNANIDYLEVQSPEVNPRTETQYSDALSYRSSYGKPLWFEEYWYEPLNYDNEYTVGIRNTHRSFIAALAFPTFGSYMRARSDHTDFPPTKSASLGLTLQNYLLTYDEGLKRMQYFSDFVRDLNTVAFSPTGSLVNRGQCGQFGDDIAIFLQGGGSVTVNLTGYTGTFQVTKLDINSGATGSLGNVAGVGSVNINSGTTADVSIILNKVMVAGPQAGVTGNRVTIPNGDNTPSSADYTDFGSVNTSAGTVTRVFTIANSGSASLTVSNVVLTGSSDFTVTASPASSVAAGASTTFSVTFNPSADGLRTATVNVSNSDTSANPYTFAIQGMGIAATGRPVGVTGFNSAEDGSYYTLSNINGQGSATNDWAGAWTATVSTSNPSFVFNVVTGGSQGGAGDQSLAMVGSTSSGHNLTRAMDP
jgi:hypothetical protein